MINNFIKTVIENGGKIKPLLVPYEISKGTGQMNPSILIDSNKILVNVRNVGYVLIHSENEQRFPSRWGPLAYTHPENDQTLRTVNVFMELNETYDIIRVQAIDTSKLDVTPKWEFIGLEDGRLVRWNDKLLLTGVRRDTTTNGVGRMEISELFINNKVVAEIKRERIESTNTSSYCEKNWMPILNKPFHYIKWSNPTEVVQVIETPNEEFPLRAKTVILSEKHVPNIRDWRGSSQIIPLEDETILDDGKYIALVHEVILFNNALGQKDAYYFHRFLLWNNNFDIIGMSDYFNFMTERMGFSCGLAIHNNNKNEKVVLMPFGHQDNSSYLAEIPFKYFKNLFFKV